MTIKIGITEFHGIAREYSRFPPEGVAYSQVSSNNKYSKYILKSAAKGVYSYVNSPEHDIIEAPLFPVLTNQPWIYTPAHFSSAGSFDFFGIPTPRFIKMIFVKELLKRDNFKKLLFKSEFGLRSLLGYGGITDTSIIKKTGVVYPAVRHIPDCNIEYRDQSLNLLFVGEFFRKGGANVVDAFLRLLKKYDDITLTICSHPDLKKQHAKLGPIYSRKIQNCEKISIGLYDREKLMTEIMPRADIYLCPTYQEAWGFSIQEAMAYGRPIITTDISAIPEMIENEKSGLMIPIKSLSFIKNSKGYIINDIPDDFMAYLTDSIYQNAERLIESHKLRRFLGLGALNTARSKFSMECRQNRMLEIYRESLIK